MIPLDLLPFISDTLLIIIVVVLAAVAVIGSFFMISRRRKAAPARAAPAPTPAKVEKVTPAPVERVDEDVVRLKVEKTATESALKSLEAAVKEGAITKETFEKHKATYSERLRKIDSELLKRTKVGITKLESEIEKVRKSYLDKLKELSKRAVTAKPAVTVAPKLAPVPTAPPVVKVPPPREAPVKPEPAVKIPEVPTARMEKAFGEEATVPVIPRVPTPAVATERPLSAAVKATPSGSTTISDLRREMMDELNRLKRLIGRAEA